MSKEDPDFIFKLVVLGDSYVGKTNIVTRYFKDTFSLESKSTVGVEFFAKLFDYKDKKIKAQIWDTAGQERYKSITKTYFRGTKGAIIVYDITRKDTYLNVDDWFHQLKQSNSEEMSIILVGNKKDLEDKREVSVEEGEQMAKKYKMGFIEASAKDKVNINQAFTYVMNKICERLIVETPPEAEVQIIKTDEGKNVVNISNGRNANQTSSLEKKKCC